MYAPNICSVEYTCTIFPATTLVIGISNIFLTANLFSRSPKVTFLLILFFLGNFLWNTSAKVSGSIPGHSWVFLSLFFTLFYLRLSRY